MSTCTGCGEAGCEAWEYLECACPCHNGPDDIECGQQDETGEEGTMTDFSGYDASGQPMYRNTADGPQCTRCGQMNGSHDSGCANA